MFAMSLKNGACRDEIEWGTKTNGGHCVRGTLANLKDPSPGTIEKKQTNKKLTT
jgi:hypothetical protein